MSSALLCMYLAKTWEKKTNQANSLDSRWDTKFALNAESIKKKFGIPL